MFFAFYFKTINFIHQLGIYHFILTCFLQFIYLFLKKDLVPTSGHLTSHFIYCHISIHPECFYFSFFFICVFVFCFK